jgi:hypothetical protein
MTMPVDYFAGVNAGTKNLIDAMTSIDQGRRADLQEKRLAENNVLARQTHAQQMEIGRENLDERRKAREAQAEVIAAFGKTDKVPATDYILNEDTSITPPTPAVLYSTEERAKNAMDAALKTGRPEAVGMATQAYEAFKKSNPDKATVFRDVMKEGAIIGRLQGKDAALARMKEHAIEHGLNPADVDNITIREDGSIGGGNAQTGTWAYDPWADKLIDHAPARPQVVPGQTPKAPEVVAQELKMEEEKAKIKKKYQKPDKPEAAAKPTNLTALNPETGKIEYLMNDNTFSGRVVAKVGGASNSIAVKRLSDMVKAAGDDPNASDIAAISAAAEPLGMTFEKVSETKPGTLWGTNTKEAWRLLGGDENPTTEKKQAVSTPPKGFKIDPQGRKIGGKPAYISADGKQVWTE